MSYFEAAIDYFIPEKLNNSPEKKRKARIAVLAYLFVLSVILTLWIATRIIGIDSQFPFAIALTILPLPLFIFRKNGAFELIGGSIGFFTFLFLFPITLHTGGLYSDDLLWLLLAPLLAFLIGGKVSGSVWSAVLLGCCMYLYHLETQQGTSMLYESPILDSKYYFISVLSLFITILGVVFIYEYQKSRLIKDIKGKRADLERQNMDLEDIVEERTRSLRESNEQLRRSNEDLERFAYVASHDLQEPLRMVGNFGQLLKEEYGDKLDGDANLYINYMVYGASRMSGLIEGLLEYSRIGADGKEFEMTHTGRIVMEKCKELSLLLSERNAGVTTGRMPTIACDTRQLSMMFHNLITNALKFNDKPFPIVQINCEETPKHWVFSVKDNGIGIDSENHGKIFEVFKRLHRKEEYEGTGIGLSMCKKIAVHHDGDIWLDSQKGVGTTFYFSVSKKLPLKKPTPIPKEAGGAVKRQNNSHPM